MSRRALGLVGLILGVLVATSTPNVQALRRSLAADVAPCQTVLRATATTLRPGLARTALERDDLVAALASQPTATPLDRDTLGRLLFRLGEINAARDVWRSNGAGQLTRFDQAADACATRLGAPEEALHIAEILIALDDTRPASWQRFADIAFGLGQLSDARRGFEAVHRLQADTAATLVTHGRTLQLLNPRDPAAVSLLEAAYEADPSNVWSLLFLAVSASETGDPASARRWLVTADARCRPRCPSAVLGGVRYAPERLHADLAEGLRTAGFTDLAAWHDLPATGTGPELP